MRSEYFVQAAHKHPYKCDNCGVNGSNLERLLVDGFNVKTGSNGHSSHSSEESSSAVPVKVKLTLLIPISRPDYSNN